MGCRELTHGNGSRDCDRSEKGRGTECHPHPPAALPPFSRGVHHHHGTSRTTLRPAPARKADSGPTTSLCQEPLSGCLGTVPWLSFLGGPVLPAAFPKREACCWMNTSLLWKGSNCMLLARDPGENSCKADFCPGPGEASDTAGQEEQPGEPGERGPRVPDKGSRLPESGWRGHGHRTSPPRGHNQDEGCVLWVSLLQPGQCISPLAHGVGVGGVKSGALTVAEQSHSHSASQFITVY